MAKATGGYQGISGSTPEGSTPDAQLGRLEAALTRLAEVQAKTEERIVQLEKRIEQLENAGVVGESRAGSGYKGISGNP